MGEDQSCEASVYNVKCTSPATWRTGEAGREAVSWPTGATLPRTRLTAPAGQHRDALHHKSFTQDVIVTTPWSPLPQTIYSWCHCQQVNTGMPYTTNHILMMSFVNGSIPWCPSTQTIFSWCHLSTSQYRDALHNIPFTHDVIVNGSIPGCPSPQTIYSWCHCRRVNTGMQMPFTVNQFSHDVIVNLCLNLPPPLLFLLIQKVFLYYKTPLLVQ